MKFVIRALLAVLVAASSPSLHPFAFASASASSSSDSAEAVCRNHPNDASTCTTGATSSSSSSSSSTVAPPSLLVPPFVKPQIFAEVDPDTDPDTDTDTDTDRMTSMTTMPIYGCCCSQPIGEMPQMTTGQSLEILQAAQSGWNRGNGEWTQYTLQQRIAAIQAFVQELQAVRDDIVHTLMYEIGKNYSDAASEFDRTIQFIQQTIRVLQSSSAHAHAHFHAVPSTTTNVMIRRNAFGIVLALGPYNYPLNETYATIIPALLMGNVVILKIPQVGGLAHLLTFQAFRKTLPPNTIHFISGAGRTTLPPIMESGVVDGLAFIGGRVAADRLIKAHPTPHRLKVFLQLEAKNMAIVLKDMVVQPPRANDANDANDDDADDIDAAYTKDAMMKDIVTGALSYNGQRCTALKIIFVPKGYGQSFANTLAEYVHQLSVGMPWEKHPHDDPNKDQYYSQITPLPNHRRIEYMQELIHDAISKGATVVNQANGGGQILKNHIVSSNASSSTEHYPYHDSSTLMVPAVLYNVTPDMKIYTEEQFGPIIPVVEYDSIEEVLSYGLESDYAQQVSIFTSSTSTTIPSSSKEAARIIDVFSAVYGKININSQCGRSPDSVPFSARRSSGMGVMSIEDALREFSVPTVVSYKDNRKKGDGGSQGSSGNGDVVDAIKVHSNFMHGL